MVAALRAYRMLLVMPEDVSIEWRRGMTAYGAELVLTPANPATIGFVVCDRGDRYLSTGAFPAWVQSSIRRDFIESNGHCVALHQ